MGRKGSPDTKKDRALKYHISVKGNVVKCPVTNRACAHDGHMTRDDYVDAYYRQENKMFIPDLYYARRRVADPFSLNVIYGSDADSEHVNQFLKGLINDKEYLAYKNGERAPKSYKDIENVRTFFEKNKNKVIIPKGTTIRTTNPKYNDTQGQFVTSKKLKVSLLNVCYGSSGLKNSKPDTNPSDLFQPVSVTWVRFDGYFYNVQIFDKILKANDRSK